MTTTKNIRAMMLSTEALTSLRYWDDDDAFARSIGHEGDHVAAAYCGIDEVLDAGLLRFDAQAEAYRLTENGREWLAAWKEGGE